MAISAPMATIRRICVYCGSGPGSDPAFIAAARAFGRILGEQRIGLIFGGGSVGLMGAVASAVLVSCRQVARVIPQSLVSRAHAMARGEMIVTRDMHERKQHMFDLADAFVALPGGIGTLEELVEQMTWAQLGRHKKPVLIANIKGFWDPLCALVDHMRGLDFIHSQSAFTLLTASSVDEILPLLQAAAHPTPDADEHKVVERM